MGYCRISKEIENPIVGIVKKTYLCSEVVQRIKIEQLAFYLHDKVDVFYGNDVKSMKELEEKIKSGKIKKIYIKNLILLNPDNYFDKYILNSGIEIISVDDPKYKNYNFNKKLKEKGINIPNLSKKDR